MVTREILNSHPVKNLKAELRKVKKSFNYGTLKKNELVELMLKNKEFFNHIKMYEPPQRKKPEPKAKAAPKEKTKEKPKEKSVDKEKEKFHKDEKEKFFKNYNFKIGDKIIVPNRGTMTWTIKDITPKYIKLSANQGKLKGNEFYSQNNKIKDSKMKMILKK